MASTDEMDTGLPASDPAPAADDDDPRKIADYLIHEHGVEGALRAVMEGIEGCNSPADFYALSVWREVKKLVNPVKSDMEPE